ncbi:MAG: F0F1 ATP synthase subunit A [Candidatus Omnitrophica bacterium]|nr:F0F1 ATP synthase subunit A [Candidatus Omnitrophota bacterium]
MNSHEWHIPFLPPVKLPVFLSLHALMIVIWSVLLLIVFLILYRKNQRVPTGITNALEAFVQFIRDDIAVPSLGQKDGVHYTPLLCTFFFFILGLNLIGMIPLFATATANINVTFALSFIVLLFLTVGTMLRNGIGGFFHALTPAGVPILILPIIVALELLGVFIKATALTVRLFANMLAGHMVILTLLGLIVMYGLIALPALALAVAISALEVFVAFLQAYIFTLLSAAFIGQMYHPDH